MTETNPRCFHLSASAISALKACPQRFRLAYREGLRPTTDTDSQRMGTNWHSMHGEFAFGMANAWREEWTRENNADQYEEARSEALGRVVDHLNERYEQIPATKTPREWALERQILLSSFIGYLWYWQNDPIEVLASEVPFELPLIAPRVKLPLPTSEVVRVGKIDEVVRWHGAVGALERKSTSRSIDPDSDYWDMAKKDTQVSMYALAFRDLLEVEGDGVVSVGGVEFRMDDRVGATIYDVWHKPTIKPAMLTQVATAEFIKTGDYCGQQFVVESITDTGHTDGNMTSVLVGGESAEIEQGKRGFAVRETVEMFGARLLADIYERPDFYFARREIVRTDQEIRKFGVELYNIYQVQKLLDGTGHWYENEKQCRATYACPYIPICYGCGADAACDGKTLPTGFKRIFVDPVGDAVTLGDD
jgi:hypothetical protein